MTVSNGSVTVGSLIVTNNINGSIINSNTFTLAGGTLNSAGTAVTNGLTFAAGNGMAAATFVLNGGVHSFANNLEIRNNATVSGCGTVTGNVVVDPGGMIVADCGGTLNFAGTVTNNATVFAVNGTTINFYGPVVNNGVINATNGLAQFYGGIINTGTGTVLNPNSWIGGNGKWENSNDWSLGVSPSLNDLVDLIANGGNNTVTIDATTTGALAGATMTISNLILRANTLALNNAGTNVPLQVLDQFVMTNGASLLISNSAMEVYGGPVVPIDGSDISLLSGSFAIGTNTLALGSVGNVSTLTVAGGTALMGDLNVGVSGNGTGTVLVTGGTLSVTNATGTGQLSLYNGAFALSNGATVVADLYTNVGGTFTNLGGTFVITSHATVNQGTATFSSGTTQIGSNFTVAATAGSTGSVYVTGGSLIATNATTTIGSGNGSVGSLTVSNATVAIGQTQIGGNANSVGMLTVQDGGQMSVSSNLLVASFFNSTGMVNVAGGQLTATNGVIGFGNNGSIVTGYGYGQMNVTNGTVLANKILLGSSTGGHGDLMIQPNGVVNLVGSNALLVPDGVEIDGGELTIENGDIQCGQASATGTYFPCTVTMTGGVATVAIVYVGYTGGGTLTISGGQMGVSPLLDVGYSSGSAGAIVMSGGTLTAGAVILGDSGIGQLSLSDNGIIQVSSSFSVGASGAAGAAGAVTLAGGALMVSVPVYVGAGSVWVSGGQLQATSLLLGYNNYGVGQLTISNGSVQVNSLVLTNGANSQIALFGGTLESGGTVVTNNHRFVVGNGSTAATFNLMAGVHWFGNGLEITSNSVLSGCGTVNGNVVVDPGGLVLANCGTLTFNNVVTNNGVLLADGGSTLESFGNLINNGSIDAINGSTNFHTGLINHGSILTAAGVAISLVSPSGQNFTVQVQSLAGHTYQLQYSASMVSPTWTNTGAPQAGTGGVLTFTDYGATADPQRFYRVLVTAP
jgi:fibronectin-binding autotransporter adhesin